MKKVMVAMSGGLDSSAVCLMLQEQGYEVEGVTMRMWDNPSKFVLYNQDIPDYIVEAKELAAKLGFPHHVLDLRDTFKNDVVAHFCNEYLSGRTPNPCVYCNKRIKWNYLMKIADERGCHRIATGHYAQIEQHYGHLFIAQGVDDTKDQSYFLWRLGNRELGRTLFPLGGMCKSEVRQYLQERGFVEKARKPESMEICFVEGDYRDFLRAQLPDIDRKVGNGDYLDQTGKVIGTHSGYPFYTIGQRKGLGIALGTPAFVTEIDATNNRIKLGEQDDLLTHTMEVTQPVVSLPEDLYTPGLTVRIRYRSKPVACSARYDGDRIFVRFHQPVSAITPGQSAVFYLGDRVVGGGIISVASPVENEGI